jgi:tetratricopeptide (TPR) repeat protein
VDASAAALDRAQLLLNARRYDDALQIVSRLPEDGRARLLAAVAFTYKNDLGQALKHAEQAIALEPEVAEAHAVRSEILYRLARNRASLEAAREAVRLEPESPNAQWSLARSAVAVRDWRLAELAAAQTLRLAPDWSMAHSIAAVVARKRRHSKEAEAHVRIALALDPNDPMTLNNVAVALSSRWRPHTRSVRLLEDAVRLDPADEVLFENLYEEARAHVRGAGIDRLDVLLGGPTIVFAVAALAVLQGWVRVPSLAGDAVIAVAVPLIIAYAIADYVRNRARLRNLKSGTRITYLSRFYREHWVAMAYFVVAFAVPVIVLGVLASALGVPGQLVALLVLAALPTWLALWPRIRRGRFNRWLPGSK